MFNFDKEAAQNFGTTSYAKIETAGKYTGRIKALELKENQATGSKGVNLHFEADSGESAKFYINTHYKHRATGEIVSNFDNISALLCCLRERNTGNHSPFVIQQYNFDTKENEDVSIECFTNLHDKRIGLLVRMEQREYYNADAEKVETMQPTILFYFEADTGFSPREILNNATSAQDVDKKLAWLLKNPVKGGKPTPQPPKKPSNPFSMPEPTGIENDIPF